MYVKNNKMVVMKFFGIGWEEEKGNREFLKKLFEKWTKIFFI